MKKEKNKKKYFFYDFVKITAAIPGLLWFRPKRIYVNEKAKKKIEEAGKTLDTAQHRSSIIQKKLKDIETVSSAESDRLLEIQAVDVLSEAFEE